MSFRDIALPLAERGFRVFPLIPKQKRPVRLAGEADHFDAASTDAGQIETWDKQEPTANAGVTPDELWCFLETDDEAGLKEACGAEVPDAVWDTTRVSARENRCYFIFRQTQRTRTSAIRDKAAKREGKENLFEFKAYRTYVTGAGSVHPITGMPYVAEWRRIPAMPDVLLNRLCELYGAPKAAAGVGNMSDEVKRETTLLDSFLAVYDVVTTGDWFNKGKTWYRPVECPWDDAHENASGGSSTCVVFTEGEGYGFDCKHRCAGKGWKVFRAELEGRFPDRKFSFVTVEQGPEAVAVIGAPAAPAVGAEVAVSDDADMPVKAPRPVYPDHVWNGTYYGEFADMCADGNFIPKKFFTESLRTVAGSIVGDRLTSPVYGANPRAFTIKIAGPGIGKGTSEDRVRELFAERWEGTVRTEDALLFGPKDYAWRGRGLGVCIINPASAPGLMKSLEPRKLGKGETLNPMETWVPLPRIITIQEEIRGLFANFANESTGAGLESILCELYDRTSFSSTATKDRAAASSRMMYGLLGGITKEGWDSVFSRVEAVESGFMSRLNIIATEEKRTAASLRTPNFDELRRRFFPLIQALEDTPRDIDTTPSAKGLMDEWFAALELPEGISKARLNIHAWRCALHLAWLKGHERMNDADVRGGIELAEYQAKMREWYAPPEGETRAARCQATIRKVMRGAVKISMRELKQKTNANRVGVGDWQKALDLLTKSGEVRVQEERTERGQVRQSVILLKIKD